MCYYCKGKLFAQPKDPQMRVGYAAFIDRIYYLDGWPVARDAHAVGWPDGMPVRYCPNCGQKLEESDNAETID